MKLKAAELLATAWSGACVTHPHEDLSPDTVPRRQREEGEHDGGCQHRDCAQPKRVLGQRLHQQTPHPECHSRDACKICHAVSRIWRCGEAELRRKASLVHAPHNDSSPAAAAVCALRAACVCVRAFRRSSDSSRPISNSRNSTPSSLSFSSSSVLRNSLRSVRAPVLSPCHVACMQARPSRPCCCCCRICPRPVPIPFADNCINHLAAHMTVSRLPCPIHAMQLIRAQTHPSWPSTRPEKRNPSTGEALTDLNTGMTSTVAARNVRKSSPSGSRASGTALTAAPPLRGLPALSPCHGTLERQHAQMLAAH